ncbi:MAG: glycosyltransferase family 4 protein [Rhabdochlamydiaceae bacterium]|nr:glycosyltransferase family 4 protein [Rhabdochlamydiaceae bacterium]
MKLTLLKSELARMGGLEKYTLHIAEAFRKKGAEVTILTTGPLPERFSDINIVRFPIDRPLSAWNVHAFDKACSAYLKLHPTPLVFGLDRNRYQTHLRAGNGSHASYLNMRTEEEGLLKGWSFRCNPLHRLLLKIEKEAFEHPELEVLFTNSHMVRKEILDQYAVEPNKVKVVHNGVEWSELQYDFDAWELVRAPLAKALHLDLSCHQLLFIGHNYQRKGLDKLLYALSLLKDKNVQLSVVGKDKNSSFYEKLASQLNLTAQVRFFGAQKQIRSFYQIADTLVIPSLYDPFANVTVEALALGLFVVSSVQNGGHEILTASNGAVIPSLKDPESIAETLRIALKHPKTRPSAEAIRSSVRHLDFPDALSRITSACLI